MERPTAEGPEGPLPMGTCTYEELAHTAEIGLRVRSDTPEGLFACAARGMFALLSVEVDRSTPPIRRDVHLTSMDLESLLVDWLSELLYLHETTGAVFQECVVTHWQPDAPDGPTLGATVQGYPPVTAPRLQIKAVTYHDLLVAADEDGWVAQVYFDI